MSTPPPDSGPSQHPESAAAISPTGVDSPVAGALKHLARILILGTLLGVILFGLYILIAILRAG